MKTRANETQWWKRSMQTLAAGIAVLGFGFGLGWQNEVRADEPSESGYYSPDDWNQASWLQRVATGQAGFYRNCDDDSAKRYSPHVYWTCKPQSLRAWPPRTTLSTLASDFDRKVQRHLWGQGGCAPCYDCQNPPGPASLLRLPPELRIRSDRAEAR